MGSGSRVPPGVQVVGFVPRLYRHFALAELIVEDVGKVAAWPEIPVDGAWTAALQILSRFTPSSPSA
jgi:hypothetical protein